MATFKPFQDFVAYRHNKAKQLEQRYNWLILLPLAIIALALFITQPIQ